MCAGGRAGVHARVRLCARAHVATGRRRLRWHRQEPMKKCEDSPDDVVNAASGGMLPSCAAGKALCGADPRIPAGCPLSCGVCQPEKVECKDSPDDVVNAASGTSLPVAFSFLVWACSWCGRLGCVFFYLGGCRRDAPELRSRQGSVRRGPAHPGGLPSNVRRVQT